MKFTVFRYVTPCNFPLKVWVTFNYNAFLFFIPNHTICFDHKMDISGENKNNKYIPIHIKVKDYKLCKVYKNVRSNMVGEIHRNFTMNVRLFLFCVNSSSYSNPDYNSML
jgi:hypothetical protein